jgi:hypothetical protein
MANLTLRREKGTLLTSNEMDDNLENLNEDIIELKETQSYSTGLLTQPEITYSGSTLTVGPAEAWIDNAFVTLPSTDFEVADDAVTRFLIATASSYILSTDRPLTEQVLVAVVIRRAPLYHIFQSNATGLALPEKIEKLLIARDGFRRVAGLGLSADLLDVTAGEGMASYGATMKHLVSVVASVNNLRFYTWDGSTYTYSATSAANNTQYNGASGLVALGNNRFNVNWFWRGVENELHLYSVLSRAEYNSIAAATASKPPIPPQLVSDHAVFIGGIVYLRNNTTPQAIIPAEATLIGGLPISAHNDLGGLQGGAVGDYQHLTSSQVNTFAAKQDPLVSGANLKTINNESLLGPGDISVAVSGSIKDIFYENSKTVSESHTIESDRNAMTAGPIEIADGVVVTVETGARWIVL